MDSLAIFAIVYDYGLILVISQKITPSFSAAGSLVETIVVCTSLCCYWIGEPTAAAFERKRLSASRGGPPSSVRKEG